MKIIVVGLGVQGRKRLKVAGSDVYTVVDPYNSEAQYKAIYDVPLDKFDAALVCTPDEAKFDILSYLLENKKHVLVEKPLLFKDSEPLKQLARIAQENNVSCYTAYNHRFEPHFVRIKEILDSGALGNLYLIRMFYGNGTARDVRNSAWRDKDMGVFSDIGSHLLDTINYWLGRSDFNFKPYRLSCFENRACDHALFGTQSGPLAIELEATMLSWRNTFTLDIIGEAGSAHINCLCKWGPSTLTVRTRILPSGRPEENIEVLEIADPTWQAEYDHFKSLCSAGQSNLVNDIWINQTLNQVFSEA